METLGTKSDENIININYIEDNSHSHDKSNLQDIIISKLNDRKYTLQNLLADLNILIDNYPTINAFTNKEFLKKNDFEIFDNMESTKLHFIINLLNMINIINLIYAYTNGKEVDITHILNELKINFSYVKNKKTENKVNSFDSKIIGNL